jgi:uncharacterized protein (UPF0333 family)
MDESDIPAFVFAIFLLCCIVAAFYFLISFTFSPLTMSVGGEISNIECYDNGETLVYFNSNKTHYHINDYDVFKYNLRVGDNVLMKLDVRTYPYRIVEISKQVCCVEG